MLSPAALPPQMCLTAGCRNCLHPPPCRPIYGLIFLFKWQKEEDSRPIAADYEDKGVFFASQVGGRVRRVDGGEGRREDDSQLTWGGAVFGFGSLGVAICNLLNVLPVNASSLHSDAL